MALEQDQLIYLGRGICGDCHESAARLFLLKTDVVLAELGKPPREACRPCLALRVGAQETEAA